MTFLIQTLWIGLFLGSLAIPLNVFRYFWNLQTTPLTSLLGITAGALFFITWSFIAFTLLSLALHWTKAID